MCVKRRNAIKPHQPPQPQEQEVGGVIRRRDGIKPHQPPSQTTEQTRERGTSVQGNKLAEAMRQKFQERKAHAPTATPGQAAKSQSAGMSGP